MVRLILGALLMSGTANAACFGPILPRLVHFQSGRTVEIVSHTAADITYRMPFNGQTDLVSTRFGIFPLTSTQQGVTISFTWLSDLADPRDQPLGKTLSYDADQSVEHATRSQFHIEINRLRDEIVTLGDCSYPAHVLTRTDTRDGKRGPTVTLWLSDFMMPLRTEVTINGTEIVDMATGLE